MISQSRSLSKFPKERTALKKLIIIVLTFALLINCAIVSYAAETSTVYDFRKLPHKEFSPRTLIQNTRAETGTSGWWVCSVDYQYASSDSFTDSSKTVRWPIDVISATFRAYSNNELKYSRSDTQNNSSHASAGYDHVTSATDCIGQHYFEEENYESWTVETYYEF